LSPEHETGKVLRCEWNSGSKGEELKARIFPPTNMVDQRRESIGTAPPDSVTIGGRDAKKETSIEANRQ
jgi:hypothetical protein